MFNDPRKTAAMNDDEDERQSPYNPWPLHIALQTLPQEKLVVAHNLRLMSLGQDPYGSFVKLPMIIRSMLGVAADMLEETGA